LTTALIWLMTLVVVSGLVGAVLQHYIPRLITQRVPMETIYDQISRVQGQLLEEADRLMKEVEVDAERDADLSLISASNMRVGDADVTIAVAAPSMTTELRAIYAANIRPYLAVRGHRGNLLAVRTNSDGMFSGLRALAHKEQHEVLDDLENICEEKRELDRQTQMHRLLHGWLLVHMPLSFALLLLASVHALMALRY